MSTWISLAVHQGLQVHHYYLCPAGGMKVKVSCPRAATQSYPNTQLLAKVISNKSISFLGQAMQALFTKCVWCMASSPGHFALGWACPCLSAWAQLCVAALQHTQDPTCTVLLCTRQGFLHHASASLSSSHWFWQGRTGGLAHILAFYTTFSIYFFL